MFYSSIIILYLIINITMLEYVPGPHNEVITTKERKYITELLESCNNKKSFGYQVNKAYNNGYHFSSFQNQYDIDHFLHELYTIVTSKYHTVQIMGSVHSEPFGHSSSLIGQYSPYGEFLPCMVKDKYIRFKIVMDHKNMKILRTFNTISVFHFLTDVPQVTQTQLDSRVPLYMNPLINSDGSYMEYPTLYPTSRYKNSTIHVITS
jgi:hypothetical protein